MASGSKSKGSKAVVWTILVLLILGLGGFGVTNFSGTISSVGTVGDREIAVQRYARELQNQVQAFSAQTGTNLTLSQARAFGLDQAVLGRLVSAAAMENEADRMGLSAGDEEVKTQLLSIPGFQGLDGTFDREAYRFTLDRAGLTEKQFEADLRAEIARTLVQGAVAGGVTAPEVYTATLMTYIRERRDFSFTALGVDALDTAIPDPNDADLRAYFEANEADFMLPEERAITYAWLTPEMLVGTVEIDEEALKELYQERIAEFVTPERRLVERLILGDAAAGARARLDAGEVTFEELVAERELDLADIDLGDVTKAELGDAGAAVFASTEAGIVGPVDTNLGGALFRVNAILAAQETPFETARATLVDDFALDRASRVIGDMVEEIDDLLAGGATLEDLAAETEMRKGQIDWTAGSGEGIAGYEAFRQAAAAAAKGDFPEITELADGGIFALRVDEITEPRLQEFADASGRVESGWRAETTAKALAAQAEALAERLHGGETTEDLGLTLQAETGITRERYVPDTPAEFLETVFGMETGAVTVVRGETAAYLVRLDAIAPPDAGDVDNTVLRDRLAGAAGQSLGNDILEAFTQAMVQQAGININQAALNAVHAQFP